MFRLKHKLMSAAVGLSLVATAATASAQLSTQPRVAIQLLTSGLTSPLTASSTDATIARLVLDTTGSPEGVRILSLPFILNTNNGALASSLTNCTVVNETNSSVDLSVAPGNGVGLVNGLNTVTLSSPLVLPSNTIVTLDLRCDPSAALVSGGSFTVSMNTANVAATGIVTGLPAVVSVRGAAPVIPPVVIPTVPNTGAGGNAAMNFALLLGSLGLATLGIAYTSKAVKQAR
ncbi:hypothetical protein KW796_00555 [Candidatus Parcubacteria bacterium]|nr:hypothetical protein [Candidatus Parcubacteria bacterium]